MQHLVLPPSQACRCSDQFAYSGLSQKDKLVARAVAFMRLSDRLRLLAAGFLECLDFLCTLLTVSLVLFQTLLQC